MKRFLAIFSVILLAACGGSDSNVRTLTIYSPHGKDVLDRYKHAFEQSHPGVRVEWLDMASQEVLDRVRSEKANPQADVWFGAPTDMFDRAASEGLLDEWQPVWAAKLDSAYRDPKGFWTGTYLTPEVIVFNTKALDSVRAPQDWDELLLPKWKGKLIIRDPMASGTMRTIFGMIIGRSVASTGDTTQGMQYLRKLDGNTKEYVLNNAMLMQKLNRRDGTVSVWDLPDVQTAHDHNLPIGWLLPRSGTPIVVEGISVVKGSHDTALAHAFMEFVGTDAMMIASARELHRLPSRSDLPRDSIPAATRDLLATLHPIPYNHALAAEKISEWMEWWDQHVRNHGKDVLQ